MWDYISKYSSGLSPEKEEAIAWLVRQTNLRTNHARMLTGDYQGRFLSIISSIISPSAILEIGVFTGYSTICLSEGLSEGGVIDALEINDELEDLIREGYARAGIADSIRLHIGDAKEILPELIKKRCCKETQDYQLYDLVYIDANKREYPFYYETVLPMVRSGGVIVADNVLWDGKVYRQEPSKDAQTQAVLAFNDMVANDPRVKNIIIPVRDGINIIIVK